MIERTSSKIRISIKDDHEAGARSLLVTGTSPDTANLAEKLKLIGLQSRGFGGTLIANGLIEAGPTGCFAEFGDQACQHQTKADATRHALHRIMAVLLEYGIEAQVGVIAADGAFVPPSDSLSYAPAARWN